MSKTTKLYARNQVIRELINEGVLNISADFYMLLKRKKLQLPETKYVKMSIKSTGEIREDGLYTRGQLDQIANRVRELKQEKK